MMDFSSKKLIENPKKNRITTSFELFNKKMINQIYSDLTNLTDADAVSLQEIND